jgi:TolA-binding protein
VLGQEPPRPLSRQAALASADPGARRGRLLAAWLSAVLLSGCTSVADVTGTATQEDLLQIRGEVAAAQQAAQRARTEAEAAALRAVDARLKTQGVEGERDIAGINRRIDGLATSITELSGRLDELSSRVEALGRQARTATPAPSAPPSSAPATAAPVMPPTPPTPSTAAPVGPAAPLGSGPATAAPVRPATPPATAATTPAPPLGQRPATNALQPQDIYQAAYIDFSKGSYPLAMAGFREFLRRFPEHPLAGNAQYWIGESHFSQARAAANAGQAERVTQEMEQAVQEYRKVLANYPRSEKAPTALYKEALALIELKQPMVAQQRLEYLVANFPQAEETPLARERLSALKTPR